MTWRRVTAITLSSLAALAISSDTAAAAPTGGGSADSTVQWLQDQGYHVQLNGKPNGSLAQCVTTGVHGLRNSNVDDHGRPVDPTAFTTVYVDISCNNTV
jgi:hypothetical protein